MPANDNNPHWTTARWFLELSVLVAVMAGIWVVMNVVGFLVGAP
jgi:hypothetical protein